MRGRRFEVMGQQVGMPGSLRTWAWMNRISPLKLKVSRRVQRLAGFNSPASAFIFGMDM